MDAMVDSRAVWDDPTHPRATLTFDDWLLADPTLAPYAVSFHDRYGARAHQLMDRATLDLNLIELTDLIEPPEPPVLPTLPELSVTWSATDCTPGVTISNGGRTATADTSNPNGAQRTGRATTPIASKGFWSSRQTGFGATDDDGGIPAILNDVWNVANAAAPAAHPGSDENSLAVWNEGLYWNNELLAEITHTPGDIVDLAVDPAAKRLWMRVNDGAWNGDPVTGTGGVDLSALPQPWYPGYYVYYETTPPFHAITAG